MTEKKFKLKKDGVCVGYMRITGGEVEVWYSALGDPQWDQSWPEKVYMLGCFEDEHQLYRTLDFDSIHDFVCLDRNGKDVYEGDKVLDRRDDKIETMDLAFWYMSLLREPMHIELMETDHV